MNPPTAVTPIKATAETGAAFAVAGGSDLAQQLYPLIAEQPLFKGLSDHQLRVLADSAMKVEFKTEESIFQQGAPANRFDIILLSRRQTQEQGDSCGRN